MDSSLTYVVNNDPKFVKTEHLSVGEHRIFFCMFLGFLCRNI